MMNSTNSIKNNRVGKALLGITLSFSIAISGSMLLAQPAHASAMSGTSIANDIIASGKQFIGVRYQFGAPGGRTDAFDCSSFTQYVFKQNGINLPRSSRQQSTVGTVVSKDQLQPGDLIFSDTNRDGVINHVSIYMGGGQVLHTYRVGIGVTISNFAGSTWDKTFVTARRVISGSVQAPAESTQPVVTQPQHDQVTTAKKHKKESTHRDESGRISRE
ncbi:C40 family peptidase [Paenibacillus spongiae]|uniref:C40 family peptidase n=1 Tax=Paenibacillus spongiae TaxID=2909671 RepID=A0ABY5SKZ9_9BACL|nr:C40 family peptidase [Paenibacillus spongiae]UVI33357.1 C40 family peptidase [Paenibacillus spongiae]